MREDVRYYVGGYIKLDARADGRTADWFATNQEFKTREEAFEWMVDYDRRYRQHGKVPHFHFHERRERVFDAFTYDSIPTKIILKEPA